MYYVQIKIEGACINLSEKNHIYRHGYRSVSIRTTLNLDK